MCYAREGQPGVWLQAVGEDDIPAIEARVRELLG
jgi:hypothetical protein